MLEGLVTWVLNNYVGEYLENLNADQISVALLQGQVELENVPLRPTALEKFDVPLEVRAGVIGRLTLQVPLAHLRSEPWVLKMSDLLVLLGPRRSGDGGERAAEHEQRRKEQQLEELEAVHKRALLRTAGLEVRGAEEQGGWWGASVVSAVSNNIQLILDNVHVRYEDESTLPDGTPFAFGFRVQQISVQTTNAQWKAGFVQLAEGVNTFKKLDIKGLSVFWNCGQRAHAHVRSPDDLKRLLSPLAGPPNAFLLRPFSLQVRLERNASRLPLKALPAVPRFKFDLRPEQLELELSRRQLGQMRALSAHWTLFDRAREHRRWRPAVPVGAAAARWWRFAADRVREQNRRRRSTAPAVRLAERARLLNAYCRAYRRTLRAVVADEMARQQKLVDPNVRVASATAVNQEDVAHLRQVERDSEFIYNELQLFRDLVFRKYTRELERERPVESEDAAEEIFELVSPESEPARSPSVEEAPRQGAGFYGWVASWFGGGGGGAEAKGEDEINRAALLDMWPRQAEQPLPPNLRRVERHLEEELLDVLSESWDDSTVLRRDSLLAEVVLQLERAIVRFVDDDEFVRSGGSRVLALDMRQVAARVFLSPREHRTEVALSVGDLSVQRLRVAPPAADDAEDEPPPIETEVLFAVGRTDQPEEAEAPLLQLFYRRLAPRLNVFHEVKASCLPVSVVYDEDALDGLSQLFDGGVDEQSGEEQRAEGAELHANTQFFLTLNVPEVRVELRTRRANLADRQAAGESTPFAAVQLRGLSVGWAATERHRRRAKVGFDSVLVRDLFEPTDWPLLRTVPPTRLAYALKARSASSPDLSADSAALAGRTYSTSLPLELRDVKAKAEELRKQRPTERGRRKPPEIALDQDFGHWDAAHVLLNFAFVDAAHPVFEREHGGQHCTVRAALADVEVGVNRRTWTLLLDFFGALGERPDRVEARRRAPSVGPDDPVLEALLYGHRLPPAALDAPPAPIRKTPAPYILAVELEVGELGVHMNFPAARSQLGVAALSDLDFRLRLNLADEEEPLRLALQMGEFSLLDSTPFHSRLYGERLVLRPRAEGGRRRPAERPRLAVDVEKHRTDDAELRRPFDLRVDVRGDSRLSVHYVHTHRFFCALLDFWLHFAELQDAVRRKNERLQVPTDCQKTRCLLNVELDAPLVLLLPLHGLSEDAICFEFGGLRVRNAFRLASQVPELEANAIEAARLEGDDYDCLLEAMRVEAAEARVHSARRRSPDRHTPRSPRPQRSAERSEGGRKVGERAFENFHFVLREENILSREFPLGIDVYRNLSSFISHNLPELAIVTDFADLELRFTADFYRLLRGVLACNLGEELIPVRETIPLEVLQSPDRAAAVDASGGKFVTFATRMNFRDVRFHFLVEAAEAGGWRPFGVVVLDRARISFDAFIDCQAELDLICESTELLDARFADRPANQKPNVFESIVRPRPRPHDAAPPAVRLMSEAHVMLRAGEAPVVTLVLANARVLLLLDWLNGAKDFVLLTHDFEPPTETPERGGGFAEPKDGVLVRQPSAARRLDAPPAQHTITLKITLKDSDLVLLENAGRANSLGLVAHTTAVLNLHDASGGVLEGQLEVQNMSLAWCLMSAEHTTRCQLTNDFDLTLQLQREVPPAPPAAPSSTAALQLLLDRAPPRHAVRTEVGEMVGRLSYRDVLVLQAVVRGALERLDAAETSRSPPPSARPPADEPPAVVNVRRVSVKAPHLNVWLLDDSQGVALPLVRLVSSRLQADFHVADRLEAAAEVAVDFFNQRLHGWEPLVEPWRLQSFLWQRTSQTDSLRIQPAADCPLNVNVTPTFVRQAKHFAAKWPTVRRELEADLRTACVRPRSDHLPYLIRNETGASLIFTTAVEELQRARAEGRRSTARWFTALADRSCTFEFPARLLGFQRERPADARRLVIRVDGWEEIKPVSVDSVGTYFRVVRAATAANRASPTAAGGHARLVLQVSVEPDGRKVVAVRSALRLTNQLAVPVLAVFRPLSSDDAAEKPAAVELQLDAGRTLHAPLRVAAWPLRVRPLPADVAIAAARPLDWRWAERPGQSANRLLAFDAADPLAADQQATFCVWASIKHDLYPEHQPPLCGHSILLLPALSVANLLPTDLQFVCNGRQHTVQADRRLSTCALNPEREVVVSLATERFRSVRPVRIERRTRRVGTRVRDAEGRELDVYLSVSVRRAGALQVAVWVPFWVVNRSGIPLVLRQAAADHDAAGQLEDHERAKDRNPLMFSFADDSCPRECVVRVGRRFAEDVAFTPRHSPAFSLQPGVQALRLRLEHEQEATRVYSIGVEVRAGSGRYRDTQVVLFEPRYHLNNRSGHSLLVCHRQELQQPSRHVRLAAHSQLIWYDDCEARQLLCIRREDLPHWSLPFRIDQVGAFHLTMRDRDETPRFVRAEVTLQNASFWTTFTDAADYPPPLRVENRSNVPVLYHQTAESTRRHHLRAICKARSSVDYAWDDLYAEKLLTLQVFENQSHAYDPSKPSQGPPLVYENPLYIQHTPSFSRPKGADEEQLVMSVRRDGGRVQLARWQPADAAQLQLWTLTAENCLENVGFGRAAQRSAAHVLDVVEGGLMMCARDPQRNATQRWRFTADGRLRCGLAGRFVELRGHSLVLGDEAAGGERPTPAQLFRKERQKPGSGVLDVHCLHVGPTLVVRIVDHADALRAAAQSTRGLRQKSLDDEQPERRRHDASTSSADEAVGRPTERTLDARLEMPAGVGVSLVSGQSEELVYAHLRGVELVVMRAGATFQLSGYVAAFQADNQLLGAERWPFLFCETNALRPDDAAAEVAAQTGARLPLTPAQRPALKLELSWTPQRHYDAFDCLRVRLADACLWLDEQLLWRLAHFVRESDAAAAVQPAALQQPPNLELETTAAVAGATRRCYFGTLELEFGALVLSARTVPKNSLPPELRAVRDQLNMRLVGFENALVQLPAFRQFHYFETASFLLEALSQFYSLELKKQTYNILVTLDAFGNPLGLVSDIKDSFQGLIFEGDLGAFMSGFLSSVAHGVGALTFDEQHELMRRRMIRSQSQHENSTALSHLYGGVKGLGVGVFGLLTALPKNMISGAQQSGVPGLIRGMATGAVDTVTKPTQGALDLLEGVASAVKDVAGGPMIRKSQWPEQRVRLPRVCTSLQSLLPVFAAPLAEAQQELKRIAGFSSAEVLLDVVPLLQHQQQGQRVQHRALVCSEQTYVLRQVGGEAAVVVERVLYRALRTVQPTVQTESGLVKCEVIYDASKGRPTRTAHVWCTNRETAARFADRVLAAKQRYDHSKRTLAAADDFDPDFS
ncbi:Ricin B-type lectin domain-containing protein [Aphelenchoides fujianensis]|nr:Ricin B-type lectin domain-containing protein [Aphelenchoides fujianensis]